MSGGSLLFIAKSAKNLTVLSRLQMLKNSEYATDAQKSITKKADKKNLLFKKIEEIPRDLIVFFLLFEF